jgi:hypothetical protein
MIGDLRIIMNIRDLKTMNEIYYGLIGIIDYIKYDEEFNYAPKSKDISEIEKILFLVKPYKEELDNWAIKHGFIGVGQEWTGD